MEQNNIGLIETLKQNVMGFINNPDAILAIITNVATAILIYWIGKKFAKLIAYFAAKGLKKSNADPILVNFLKNFIYFAILIAVIVAALGYLGVKTTSLLGMLAAAGLAIGLALKDSLSNFASGVMIVMFRPFKIGDFVEVAGQSGKIAEIKIFSTILNTNDNKLVIIPNGQITSDSIINHTAKPIRRVDIAMGVGYDDDLKKARNIMMQAMDQHPLVLQDPAPSMLMTELADSSVNFSVRPWAKTGDYWTVYGDLLEQFKTELEAGGCSIPYPQTDVHLHTVKGGNA
ncbi:Potassium efflux system KefA protein / Small-conductance mechanosensitive channel [hydrothermal vent metagenome]|uniref:Potassium efflux system KefA protein / Small-conductance mechanosensitive channel n=1 Tax=hydrothermal vent metagenome TaxID=652676 RepID=A0A3B0V8X7_9ZZZZ